MIYLWRGRYRPLFFTTSIFKFFGRLARIHLNKVSQVPNIGFFVSSRLKVFPFFYSLGLSSPLPNGLSMKRYLDQPI